MTVHFRRLVKQGLHWEAAQIFGLIDPQDKHWIELETHLNYTWLMYATGEKELMADLQNDRASYEGRIENALAIVSAKSTYAEHVMHCEACTQGKEGQSLNDSLTMILQWLFRRLPNTQPRGKLFDIQTRLGAFLLQDSIEPSQIGRYSSSRDTRKWTYKYGSTTVADTSRVHLGNLSDTGVNPHMIQEHDYSSAGAGKSALVADNIKRKQTNTLLDHPPASSKE